MYRQFYGLRERPFDLTPDPRFLVLTDGHREALSNLRYGIDSRKGVTLLLGEAGVGKTTIIRAALQKQASRIHSVYLHNPALTRDEFSEMLALKFELSETARTSKTAMLIELERLLVDRDARGETTVLIIDEAQTLSLELLEEVRLLANIETLHAKLLSVVLAGQPELAGRLNDSRLRQLKQRVALRCELKSLTLYESFGYLAGRIATAGGDGGEIFTREAAALIHERARGLPRTMSVIADNALVSGFALNKRPITHRVVDEVCRDFDLVLEPPPPPPPLAVPSAWAPGAEGVAAPVAHVPATVPHTVVPHVAVAPSASAPAPVAPVSAPAPVTYADRPETSANASRLLVFESAAAPVREATNPTNASSASETPGDGHDERETVRGVFGSLTRKRRGFFGFLRQA
jgi:general secretion pathway protein A